MFMPDDCEVKQIFRNDFVDMVDRLVNGTDYYTFQLYGNARSQGPPTGTINRFKAHALRVSIWLL